VFIFFLMVGLAQLFWGAMYRIVEAHWPQSRVGKVLAFAH